MSYPMEVQIDWIKHEIEAQVDVGIEQFSIVESGEGKLLEFVKVVAESTVRGLRVGEALDCFYYLQDIGKIPPGKDRITQLVDYFVDWIGLELAKRYA